MANSKARCAGCKQYKVRSELSSVGLSSVCTDSPSCRRLVLDKAQLRFKERAISKVKKAHKPRLRQDLRKKIRSRDEVCRYCGVTGDRLEIHHIAYRSQGGPDASWNLILLCDEHHRLAHSRKRYWQPVLRAYIWLYYVEGHRYLTVPIVEKMLDRRGLLPLVEEDPDDGQLIA